MAPTFASAAAGNNANSSRPDSSGEWPRRTNGATQTFRRPSHATTPSGSNQANLRDATGAPNHVSTTPTVYVPPHAQSGRNGGAVEGRYSREQMLQMYSRQQETDSINQGLSDLYVGSWEPHVPNGTSGATWGRRDDNGRDAQNGVDLCWNRDGTTHPLSLSDLTEEERETFTSSVNSPMKPPVQNTTKDGTPKDGLSLRKTSTSQGGGTPYGIASPTTARPGNRRRDTSEAYPFPSNGLASPATSRFARDEPSAVTPPPSLVRRRTETKDPASGAPSDERDKTKAPAENAGPFGTVKRTTTGPFSQTTSTNASPWSATQPAGGYGAFGNFALPQPEKKPGFGSVRGESRFKGLMNKSSTEDFDKAAKDKTPLPNLGKLSEAEPSEQSSSWMETRSNRPTSNDTDPYAEGDLLTGSAALGGGQDHSPPRQQVFGAFSTPSKQDQRDDGFSAFGMTTDNTGLRDIFHGRDHVQQTPFRAGGEEPMSPTDTNPYQSPEHVRDGNHDGDSDASDLPNANYPGMGSFQIDTSAGPGIGGHGFGALGGLGRASHPFEIAASDRSQTSSVGPNRGFAGLHGLGGLPGLGGSNAWSSGPQQQTIGTPIRERGFGGGFEAAFGPSGTEMNSPSLSGLGSSSLFAAGSGLGSGSGSMRQSKLGSLFPTAMQEQMRDGDSQYRLGTFGRNAFGSQAPGGTIPARDTDSPLRRSLFEAFSGPGPSGTDDQSRDTPASAIPTTAQVELGQIRTASAQATKVNSPGPQPPTAQQRTMVMPDRMRWIYRDPLGNTQGPFSGLEMHDWYKAGFFSPELLVKKQEDPEYEPLAQLIRRIGNSREPFLVPQIGIPHGPPSTQTGNAWAGTAGPSAGAQPPFANSFPSFGTTLTAEQQNALERRKQEEQYLMARQKEHLAAQQTALAKQAQLGLNSHGILPHQLQHHSSAHSLHSQPSYGSITSPGGYQASPTQAPLPAGPGPVPGLFDNTFRPGPVPGLGPIGPGIDALGNIREEDMPAMMDRLHLGRTGQAPFATATAAFGQQQPDSNAHAQQVNAMLGDRARLQREQAEHDAQQRTAQHEQQATQAAADRLQQFQDLRLQTDLERPSSKPVEGGTGQSSVIESQEQNTEREKKSPVTTSQGSAHEGEAASHPSEPLSLTEQVQKAASAKQSPAPQSPWAKVDASLHPFPPPPSQSPLPAPAAQRKPIVADNLTTESRSRSETPSADTPSASLAPWAKEPTEAAKGPSLKEIQETEARKAAEREALMVAARREAFERELAAHAQSPAAQPGLPPTASWASGASPITPSGTSSVWIKPVAGKVAGQPSAATKKTLQQIQKEEEARKQRQAATVVNTATFGVPTQALSSGKRYADLASKPSQAQPSVTGAWTTVGASGKTKTPAGTPTITPATLRSTSSGVIPSTAKKPTAARTTTMGGATSKANAEEEFRKWAIGELRPDLNKGISAEEFVASLLSFPQDIELITESVHSASSTLDSRHFAEEYLRRRKLADKGIFDNSGTASPADARASSGGWNEVAKKGGQGAQQQQHGLDSGNFKVVAAKKGKGVKR